MMMAKSNPVLSMERKSDVVRRLVAAGSYKDALKIAKDFHLGIEKDDSENMKLGYECIVHPHFYEQLGEDTVGIVQKGVDTLKRLYGE